VEEYLIPAINGLKKRNLTYKELEWLFLNITEGGNKPHDKTRLKQAIEKAKEMFTVTSVMVLVKGGTFQTKSPVQSTSDLEDTDNIIHSIFDKEDFQLLKEREKSNRQNLLYTVNLTYDYYIGKYEVTFNEYDAFCESTGYEKPNDEGWGRGSEPVLNVDWVDAITYCNWLSGKEGMSKAYDEDGNLLDKNGKQTKDITKVEGYRLPTEAEWEYAARGGHKSSGDYKYAGSNSFNRVAWCYIDFSENPPSSHKVGLKAPNELGLYDMSGNLYEWCHDGWNVDYPTTPQTNPIGPDSFYSRVKRGGSWYSRPKFAQVNNRQFGAHCQKDYCIGFRIARTRK